MKKITMIIAIAIMVACPTLRGQAFHIKFGVFQPQMQSDLWEINMENLAFARSDMIAPCYGLEAEYFLGRFASFSCEIGNYSKTVLSEYRDYVYEDGSPIYQNIKLAITPIEVNFKLYPFTHRQLLFPYIGIGGGIYAWTYEQWGEFINFEDMSVSEGTAITQTYSFGANARAGLVFRFHRNLGVSVEGKYQYVKGELSGYFEGFEKFDLSGFSVALALDYYFR